MIETVEFKLKTQQASTKHLQSSLFLHLAALHYCTVFIGGLISSNALGDTDDTWNIAYVTLNVAEKFRYIFQGIVGSEKTSGAIFIDDIILSETTCPSAVWRIQKFTGLLESTLNGESVRSACFYGSEGYGYGIDVYPNGRINSSADYVGVTFHLCSGESDAVLEWPAINRQITITFMDQDPDVTLQMSNSRSFTTG